jgi:ribosomal protein S18 acetylase RimI-like enzyme
LLIRGEGFEIRPAGEEERAAILGVYERCEDFLALGPQPKASMGMVLDDLRHSRAEGGVFCGIFMGGEMAGVVDFVPDGFEGNEGVAFLSLLMISREHRARGLGRRVVEAVEAEMLRGGGIREIRSGVQVNNPAAIAFWTRMGYMIVSGPKAMPDQTTVYDLQKIIVAG